MSSTNFIENYKKICKTDKIDPDDVVLEQLKGADSSNRVLNFSTTNLCRKSCGALGKYLSTDLHFIELRLADSLLQEDALKILLRYLERNKGLQVLDLKGNNIRGEGAAALGNFLRKNHFLKTLTLEWNNIGVLSESVRNLCDGLSKNDALQELILRNNQISHVGAAEISIAMKANSTLRVLDLRWNNIGLLGGRALTEVLKVNRSLIQICLNGNNIPTDTLNAIDRAVKFNSEQRAAFDELQMREHVLKRGLMRAEESANVKVNNLLSKLDLEQQKFDQVSRVSSTKIIQLQELLDQRLTAFHALESKYDATQSELSISRQRNDELEELLTKTREETSTLRSQHLNILREERDEHSERQRLVLGELRTLKEEKQKLETLVTKMEEKSQVQLKQFTEIREELSRVQDVVRSREAEIKSYEEKNRYKDQELELKQRDGEQQRRSLLSEIDSEKEKNRQLEAKLRKIEDEMAATAKRCSSEISLAEEKANSVRMARDDLERTMAVQALSIRELQGKLETSKDEVERRRKDVSELEKKVEKGEEMKKMIEKLRIEVHQANEKEREMSRGNEQLEGNVKLLKGQIQEMTNDHKMAVKECELDLSNLREQLRLREEHWKQLTEKEVQRVHLLHSAIGAYLQGTPSKPM